MRSMFESARVILVAKSKMLLILSVNVRNPERENRLRHQYQEWPDKVCIYNELNNILCNETVTGSCSQCWETKTYPKKLEIFIPQAFKAVRYIGKAQYLYCKIIQSIGRENFSFKRIFYSITEFLTIIMLNEL